MKPLFISALFVIFLNVLLPKELGAVEHGTNTFALQEQLMQSIRNGKPELVEALLKKGADPNNNPLGVFPPLDDVLMDGSIAKESKIQIALLLIKFGAAQPSETSLHYIFNQRLDKVLYALIAANPADESLMQVAITKGDLALVKRLLQSGYPPSEGKIFVNGLLSRANPLQAAVALSQADIVKVLMDAGASLRPQGEVDGTTFTNAELIAESSPEILKMFLERGLSPSEKNRNGRNLLMFAASRGKADSIHLLISKGAKIDAKDQYQDTALILAAGFGNIETVKALLGHRPNLFLFGSGGQNAKIIAFVNGHQSVVDVLEQAGLEGYAGKGIPNSFYDHEIAGKVHVDITADYYFRLPFLHPGLRFFSVTSTRSFSPEAPTVFAVFADRRVVKLVVPTDFQTLGIKITSGRDALRFVREFDSLGIREFMEIPGTHGFMVSPLGRLKEAGMTEPEVKLAKDGKSFVIKRFGLPISEDQFLKQRSAKFDSMMRSFETVGREGQYSQTTESIPVPDIFARPPFIGIR